MTDASFLANPSSSTVSPSPASSVAPVPGPPRRFGLSRAALVLIAGAVALSACAAGPERPPYPGRRSGGMSDSSALGGTAAEMRSAQSVLSSGNSILGTIGSIGRNISRLGR